MSESSTTYLSGDSPSPAVDSFTARLGALARRAKSSESLLTNAVELVQIETGVKTCGIYLCNISTVVSYVPAGSQVTFVREAVLLAARGPQKQLFLDRVDFQETAEDLKEALNRNQQPEAVECIDVIPFFHDGELRGVLALVGAAKSDHIDAPNLTRSLGEFCVMLELVTDRYLLKTFADLNAKCLMLLSDHPQDCMCGILTEMSAMLGCDGISFFAIDQYENTDVFHLVATFPNAMPSARIWYDPSENTLTSKILSSGRDCVIHYPATDRSALLGLDPAKWRDVPKGSKSETVIYIRLCQGDETVALLRCTNKSNKHPSRWFNWLDMRRAMSLASLLLPYYKAAQKEDRFASSLSDISHEIKTMSGGIKYTALNIRDQLSKFPPSKVADLLLKVGHIDKAATSLRALLPGLRMEASVPAPQSSVQTARTKGFRPYADLCKPLAEMYIAAAKRKGIDIQHFGQDQLGLVFADIDDFRHIVTNLVSNAVKYTNIGTPIYIRYERPSERRPFAAIIIGSHSLPIRSEESSFIFKYRQRALAAKSAGIEGEGIGLAIARAKARQYGGDVVFRSESDINIFTLLIPKRLFYPD